MSPPVFRSLCQISAAVTLITAALAAACRGGDGFSGPGDAAPTLAVSGDSVTTAGVAYTLSYSASDDSGLESVAVAWGDGSPNDTVSAEGRRVLEGSVPHIYAAAGTLQITVEAADVARQTASETLSLRVLSDDSLAATFTIDASQTFQTIDGWGFSLPAPVSMSIGVNPLARFPFQPGDDDIFYDRLFDTQSGLGMNIITFYQWWDFDGSWSGATRPTYEETNDDSDPNTINWAGFDLSPDWPNWKVAEKARPYGVKLKVTVGGVPAWLATGGEAVDPAMGDEFGEYLSAFILYARDTLGLDVEYLSIMNEPNNNARLSAGAHATLLNRVATMLDAKGLTARLVAPEAVSINGATTYSQQFINDPAVSARLGAISTHPYGGDTQANWQGLFDEANAGGLRVWQTEYSTANSGTGGTSYTIDDALRLARDIRRHLIQGNVSAWFNFLGVGCECGSDGGAGGSLIIFRPLSGSNFEFLLPPRYFAYGQFSKYIRPGDQRVAITPEDGPVQPIAFRTASGGIVVVLVNSTTSDETVSIAGWEGASQVSSHRTSATENGADLGSIPVQNGRVSLTIPAKSITTLATVAP